jgi:hypothetical protein
MLPWEIVLLGSTANGTFFPSPLAVSESFYKSTFSHTGNAGDSYSDGFICMWQTGFYHFIGSFQMVRVCTSIKVIALLNAVMLPDKIPVTNSRRMVAVF